MACQFLLAVRVVLNYTSRAITVSQRKLRKKKNKPKCHAITQIKATPIMQSEGPGKHPPQAPSARAAPPWPREASSAAANL